MILNHTRIFRLVFSNGIELKVKQVDDDIIFSHIYKANSICSCSNIDKKVFDICGVYIETSSNFIIQGYHCLTNMLDHNWKDLVKNFYVMWRLDEQYGNQRYKEVFGNHKNFLHRFYCKTYKHSHGPSYVWCTTKFHPFHLDLIRREAVFWDLIKNIGNK